MVAKARVTVEGLDEWRKGLARADLKDRVKQVNLEAARYVSTRADVRKAGLVMRYPSYGHVTIKANKLLTGAAVTVGPRGQGYAAELGANVHPVFGRRIPQESMTRRVWPPHSTDGQMVWPVIKSDTQRILDIYDRAMAAELRPAFPD